MENMILGAKWGQYFLSSIKLLTALVLCFSQFHTYANFKEIALSEAHNDYETAEMCDQQCEYSNRLENTVLNFVSALNQEETEVVAALIDFEHIATTVSQSVSTRKRQQVELYKGFIKSGSLNLAKSLLSTLIGKNSPTWYLRTIEENGELKPLLRIDIEDGGHEYLLLSMNSNASLINNIYFASSGATYINQLEDATQLLIKPSESIFAKMFGLKKVDKSLTKVFMKLGELRTQHKFAEAYELLSTLPESVRSNKVVLLNAVKFSMHLGDDFYLKELNNLAKYHSSDPDLQFMLVDYYFLSENYSAGMKALNAVEARYGEDGALFNLKANLRYAEGNYDEAVIFAKQAIDVEYNFEDAYWTLATIMIEQANFVDVADIFSSLVSIFSYEFSRADFDDEFYSEYVKSAVFEAWIIAHKADLAAAKLESTPVDIPANHETNREAN